MRPIHWWVLALLLVGVPARADRDIVYSARYYYPPGTPTDTTRTRSRFHLYRINPDGSGRRQITRGRWDDLAPQWSPDGRRILFLRDRESSEASASRRSALCLVGANGGPVRTLLRRVDFSWPDARWSPDGRNIAVAGANYEGETVEYGGWLVDARSGQSRRLPGVESVAWSPDSRYLYMACGRYSQRRDMRTGKTVRLPQGIASPVWTGRDRLAGILQIPATPKVYLRVLDGRGRTLRRVDLRWNVPLGGPSAESANRGLDMLLPMPGEPEAVVCAFDVGHSGNRPFYAFVRVSLRTGEMKPLCYGQFLAWSGDRKRICTAPPHDLAPYDKERDLYTAALQVGAPGREHYRDIVRGMVWVAGADWRRGSR